MKPAPQCQINKNAPSPKQRCILYYLCDLYVFAGHCATGITRTNRQHDSTNYLLVVPNHLVKISSYLPFSWSFLRASFTLFRSSSFFLDTAMP